MTHEDHGPPCASDFAHFPQAFALEFQVTHRQNFVHHENFRFKVSCDREGQAYVHTRGVMFDCRIHEVIQLSEGDDFVKLASDFPLSHAENCATEVCIFAAREFRVEARADFQKATHATANLSPALGGPSNPRKNL